MVLLLGGGGYAIYNMLKDGPSGGDQQAKVKPDAPPPSGSAEPTPFTGTSATPSGTTANDFAKPAINPVPPPANGVEGPAQANPKTDSDQQTKEPSSGETEPKKSPDAPPPELTKNDPQPPPPVPPVSPPKKNPDPPQNPFGDPDLKLPNPKKEENRSHLPKDKQEKVNLAVDKGVKYLLTSQKPDGTWPSIIPASPSLGYTALPALTLLECGVSPNDKAIQATANYLRFHSPAWKGNFVNYDLSLTLLFLDRLGDPKDRELIRFLALRLIATQRSDGGWAYFSPLFTNAQALELLKYLQDSRPEPYVVLPGGKLAQLPKASKDGPPPVLQGPVEPIFKTPLYVNQLSPAIRALGVVTATPAAKLSGRKAPLFTDAPRSTDNSNTQFAMMALWVARKYDIPVAKTMALMDQRFSSTQHPDGGWGYHADEKESTDTMTCAGLIGLALGHWSHKETVGLPGGVAGAKTAKEDPAIKAGLAALGKWIGDAPPDWSVKAEQKNIYFIWSVERVAVLYNLKTIGGKDWYSWAAHMLVTNQQPDGSWRDGKFSGDNPSVNTALSLLVLKRANLVADLTESLKEYIPITDPGSK